MSRNRAATSALVLATLVQLLPVLFLGRPIGTSDILTRYPPWRVETAREPSNPLLDDAATALHPWMAAFLRHRELVATPSVGCGATGPLAGLFGILSPFVLVPFAALPRSLALTGMALLDLVFAFLAFYCWRRGGGDDPVPASLGAAVWAFAPARTVLRTWPHAGILALFPLLLLAVDGLAERLAAPPVRWRRIAAWALLTIAFVLGGHPSFVLLGVFLAALYGVCRGGIRLPSLVPPAAGGLLALVVLSPVLALGRSFLASGEWLAVRAPIAEAPPVPWRVLLLLFDPSFYGDPVQGNWRGLGYQGPDNLVELQLYMGLLTLLLAPLGVFSSRKREARLFTFLALFCLAAFLVGGPFAAAARLLPGVETIFLCRLRLLVLFSAAVLVSLGAPLLFTRVRSRALPYAFLAFLTLDLSLATQRFTPFPETPDGPPPETPALSRLRELAPGDGRRFLGLGNALPPNVAFELDLEDVRAHLLFSGGYRRLLTRLDDGVFGRHGTFLTFESATFRPDPDLLSLLGVSALIAPPGSPAPGGDFAAAYRGPDADVYQRPWTPPARLVSASGGSSERTGAIERFTARRLAWDLTTDAPAPGTLLLGRSRLEVVDVVTVDGRRVRPREDPRAPGLLAVEVPGGRHQVSIRAALPVSLAVPALAGLAALGVVLGLSFPRRATLPGR